MATKEHSILIQASPEYLSELIVSGIREELKRIQLHFTEKSQNDELMTKKQVCNFLNCSSVSLWNWENKGMLAPVRLGRSIRYKKSDVEQFINRKTNK
ncbi:helix-turn-helix transcriptional regulator [Chryseobacterium polytrichastri]|uniref:Transcriptional regulator, AlpA family n=1 Tax=Chryseobacterium polytrichastri TaxID=1302687 RepID=A0A1M6TC26_9FLAO|nr:helix-turn-helix domain-containing protein [Chryseobacterium polytrichastri]SHK54386.1 transcriptional regulator, AlpA family [Chryseobacterium polytrichastri]